MKKIIVVSLLSLIIFGVISTLVYENTWAGFKYKFVLGSLNGLIPFVMGTTLYHFILLALQRKMVILNTFLAQICLATLISFILVVLVVAFGNFFDGTSNKTFGEEIWRDAGFGLGAGITVGCLYYLVSKMTTTKG
jgi:hypothetical protein